MTRVVVTALVSSVLSLWTAGCGGAGAAGPEGDEDAASADAADAVDTAGQPDRGTDGDADGAGPDGAPPPPWEGLTATGVPVDRIAGVASHVSVGPAPDPLRDFEFDQYEEMPGFGMRRGLRWSTVEPARGDWRIEAVRTVVDMAVEHGVRILPLLAYGNPWAQADPELYGTLNVADYANYAGRIAAAFCESATDYEVWNEENIERFWHLPPDPAKYADMLIASAAAIRAACPGARVVFGGLASYDFVDMTDCWGFLRRALEARPQACGAFDAVALHPYTWLQFDPPEHDAWVSEGLTLHGQSAMTRRARDILAAAGCGEKAILFTEVGWPSYDLTEDQVARYAARSLLLAARDGVEGWYWYTFWDDDPADEAMRPHENHFGLWAWPGPDGSVRRAKPAWLAVKAAVTLLRGYRFARDLGESLDLPSDVYVLVFVDDGGRIKVAAWDGREMPDETPDGVMPGGPDTTYPLDLPLPDGTMAVHAFDQDGTPTDTVSGGATIHRVLTPRVQYLEIERTP